jgi:acyl-CoA hydrolase
MPNYYNKMDGCVDEVLAALGSNIVLGMPLGIGKPNPFVNVLYRRIKANPQYSLKILTALTLSRPKAHSDLEKAFLEPFAERVFGDYPDLDYDRDQRAGQLPANITVHEFFLKSGDYLNNDVAQQHYLSTNYTFAARDIMIQGANLVTQAVAVREKNGKTEYSLSCNPEVTLELLPLLRTCGRPVRWVLVVNRELPFMENDAIADLNEVDAIIDDPVCTHTLFSAPNMKISLPDYSIGVYASSLVLDGGTLQIGIGSLGDAIAQALIVRHRHNGEYQRLLTAHGLPTAGMGPFVQGLFGCSEMFVNGFMQLIKAGVIRREVYDDVALQTLLNQGAISVDVNLDTIDQLLKAGRIRPQLDASDLTFLKRFGILRAEVEINESEIMLGGLTYTNDLRQAETRDALLVHGLGQQLREGRYMHGGFFLGPRDFYQALRDLNDADRARINMTRIGFINQLYGQEDLARVQRRDARFINTCMMMTMLGSAVSDALDNGRVVSGVGGQYNFVAQAHALHDARSILLLRASRQSGGEAVSNIIWNYAHCTIPRHLRDIVITEYGIADLRGQADNEVIKRLLAIADSRFQHALMIQAKNAGKLEHDYNIPENQQHNLPEILHQRLDGAQAAGLLPGFPFGTDFTPEELEIVKILQRMKESSEHPLQMIKALFSSVSEEKTVPQAWLERMQLDQPDSLKQKLLRQLFIGNV